MGARLLMMLHASTCLLLAAVMPVRSVGFDAVSNTSAASSAVGRWSLGIMPSQLALNGSNLYVFGDLSGTSGSIPALQVYHALTGSLVDEVSISLGPPSASTDFDQAFLVTEEGDVILRSSQYADFTVTSTTLRRYSPATKQLEWEVLVETLAEDTTVGALFGRYVYTTINTQLRVVDAVNGTLVKAFSVPSVQGVSEALLNAPVTAHPAGSPGYLIVNQGLAVLGYSLAEPADPTLLWNATSATGAIVPLLSRPLVSLDGRWVLGSNFPSPATESGDVGGSVVVIDTTTGATRTRDVKHIPTVLGASGTFLMLSTSVEHGQLFSSTFGTFNLTSMEYVQRVRLHVLGKVACGLATDGSVFVCATQAATSSATSTNPNGIGFTVFDAMTTGAIIAKYAPSTYNLTYVPLVTQGGRLTVVPSADGQWINVFFVSNVALVQLPRTKAQA